MLICYFLVSIATLNFFRRYLNSRWSTHYNHQLPFPCPLFLIFFTVLRCRTISTCFLLLNELLLWLYYFTKIEWCAIEWAIDHWRRHDSHVLAEFLSHGSFSFPFLSYYFLRSNALCRIEVFLKIWFIGTASVKCAKSLKKKRFSSTFSVIEKA